MVVSLGQGYSAAALTEQQVLAARRSYVAASRTGCLIFHGSGNLAREPYSAPYGSGLPGTGLMKALAEAEVPCMSADWGGTNTWGNDTAISRADDGYAHLTSSAAKFAQALPGEVLLAGFSMGAANALNWATRNLSKVKAIVIAIPIVDLQHAHDDGVAAAAMEAAYTNLAGLQAAYATHSPINFASNLSSIPIGAWYGKPDTDSVVRPADVEAFAAAQGNCVLHSLGSAAHNANLIPASEMAAFLTAQA